MRFSILRYTEELVTQTFFLWTILQGILRHFKGRILWCVSVPSNVTSRKQPCDLGVFAAVKKAYKVLLLKYILSFRQLDSVNQQLLEEECFKFRRGSVGVRYVRLASVLDAANYIKEELHKVSYETIKNTFVKTHLGIILNSAVVTSNRFTYLSCDMR